MSRVIKKLMITMMSVLLCLSTINWQIFAEDAPFSAWAEESEIYTDVEHGTSLVVNVSDESLELKYQWYQKIDDQWIMIAEDGGSEYQFGAFSYPGSPVDYKCVVSGYDHTVEVPFHLAVSNTIADNWWQDTHYIGPGESVTLNNPYVLADASGLIYQWYLYDENVGDFVEISGATESYLTVNRSGDYRIELTDTKYNNDVISGVFHVIYEEEDPGFEPYTVTYHLYVDEVTGEEVTEAKTYSEESTRPLPYNEDNFENYRDLDHKVFRYWSMSPDGGEFEGLIGSNTDLYAVYSNAYVVTYKYETYEAVRKIAEDRWWEAFSNRPDNLFEGFETPAGKGFRWWSRTEDGREFYNTYYEDITLYAVFSDYYNVTYHAYGEVVGEREVFGDEWDVRYEDNSIFDKFIKHDGEMFVYWSETEGGPRYWGEAYPDMHLYAVFGTEYTVTYVANGITLDTIVTVGEYWYRYLDQYEFPGYEPVDGKVFCWWSETEGGENFRGPLTHDTVLYAVFATEHTVRYWCEGKKIGEITVRDNDPHMWDYPIEYFRCELPEGKAFLYWSESEGGPQFSGYVTEDKDLYAVFEDAYTVTYYMEGNPIGTKNIPKSRPWDFNVDLDYFGVLAPPGYGLSYWATADGKKFEGPVTRDIELYAVLGELHTVQFFVGNQHLYDIEYADGENLWWYGISDYYQIPDDEVFSYWATEDGSRFTGRIYEDMKLYAVFVKAVNITYVFSDDLQFTVKSTGFERDWYNYPDPYMFPGYSPEEGKQFKWWSLTPDGPRASGDFTEDTTLYAVFAAAYTVTYWYEGTEIGQRSIVEGSYDWYIEPEYLGFVMPDGLTFNYWADSNGVRFEGPIESDLDLYLVLDEGFIITYWYNGNPIGTSVTPKSRPWNYGFSLAYFDITPPEGYDLAYWSDTPDGKEFTGRVTGDMNLYAVLGELQTVEYYAEGNLISTKQIPAGSRAFWIDFYEIGYTVPENMDFAYWSEEENGTEFEGPITGPTRLYAVFYQKYRVEFYQGDVFLGSDKFSRQYAYDIMYIRPDSFERYTPVEGYTFDYWMDENGNRFTESMLVRDIKLYAHFARSITVRYHYDGEIIYTRDDASSTDYNIDEYLYNHYDWNGYSYYYSLSEYGEYFNGNFDGYDVDLYIVRYKNPMTITFDAMGGTIEPSSMEYYDGPYIYAFRLSEYVPVRSGYYFAGWSYDRDGKQPLGNGELVFDDFTLYANWVEDSVSLVKLSINDDSGKGKYLIEGEEGEYPIGSTVTFKITVTDDRTFIYSSLVERTPGDVSTDIVVTPSLTREITFKTTAGINNVDVWCYQGNNKMTFVVDPQDRSKDIVLYTDRFGNFTADQAPVPQKEGYYLLGWKRIDMPESNILNLNTIFIRDEVLVPVYEKTGVEANIKVELYKMKLVEDPQWGTIQQEELVDPSKFTITGAGRYNSGSECVITVKSNKPAAVDFISVVDPSGRETAYSYFANPRLGETSLYITNDGYSIKIPTLSVDQTVKIYIDDDGSVKVNNLIPEKLTVNNNAANGIATGETVTITFDIAEGYALDKERPFVYDKAFMRSFSRYLSMDGDMILDYENYYGTADYTLDKNIVKVTDNSISWKMGYGDLEFTPNIVFVGYGTQEENNLEDTLNVDTDDQYSNPGILFYNNSAQAKEYSVTFTLAEVQETSVSASMAAARNAGGFVKSSSVTSVEGEDGIGSVMLYVIKGKVGEAGVQQDPVFVRNLQSVDVKVEAGEFVSYSLAPTVATTEASEIKFEVKDEKGASVQDGYISVNDDHKHLVYEGSVATIDAPTIKSSSMNTKGVTLKWSAVTGADEYVIYRKEGTGDYEEVGRSATTSFVDETAWAGTKYTYAVKAHSNSPVAYSEYSAGKTLTYNPFTDVKSGTAHYKNIMWAFNVGLVNGTSKTTFSPEGTCMRKSFAIMLWKLMGKPASSGTNPFTDLGGLTKNEKAAIQWCYENKIVNGLTKTTFGPEGDVTRKAVVIMLWKAAGKPTPTITVKDSKFTDISKLTKNEQSAILWAFENGITKGTTKTTFGPEENCLREQLCTFLARYNNLLHIMD